MQNQIPVLCKTCRGTQEIREDFSLVCPYCGTHDQLPLGELERVLELKARLALAARSVLQLEKTHAALARIYEDKRAFSRVQGIWLVVFILVVAYSLIGILPMISSIPGPFRLSLIISGLTGPMFIGGICLSLVAALSFGRFGYRKNVRPLLLARPPKRVGEPTRCRCCGGEMAGSSGPFVGCGYCGTNNVITKEVQEVQENNLRSEEDAYRKKAQKSVTVSGRYASKMTRTFLIAVVVVYLFQFVLLWFANFLIK